MDQFEEKWREVLETIGKSKSHEQLEYYTLLYNKNVRDLTYTSSLPDTMAISTKNLPNEARADASELERIIKELKDRNSFPEPEQTIIFVHPYAEFIHPFIGKKKSPSPEDTHEFNYANNIRDLLKEVEEKRRDITIITSPELYVFSERDLLVNRINQLKKGVSLDSPQADRVILSYPNSGILINMNDMEKIPDSVNSIKLAGSTGAILKEVAVQLIRISSRITFMPPNYFLIGEKEIDNELDLKKKFIQSIWEAIKSELDFNHH